jgi:uncharacterized membrane protein YgcG
MRSHYFNYFAAGLSALAGVALMLAPGRAEACGGTFCDGGVMSPMPVDQTGENVIFVMGGTEAEVHIQISYDPNTNAQDFAWMIPLTNVPEFSVGSTPLFDQIRAATVPQYGVTTSFEGCGGDGGATTSGATTTSPDSGFTGGGESSGGPDVLLMETVGAFEVAVLQDTELAPIQAWLEDNGYAWDANAGPILQEYLDEGNVIAAFRLKTGAGLADVHPITLRYDSLEVCFPLRLTRIAAVEDMDIRVFVLGSDRAAPTNYRHVLVNPLKIDWLNFAANYKEVITNAVDATSADGRAFVTEFAGSSGVVSEFGIYNPLWDEQPFIDLDPVSVIAVLNDQGLADCDDGFDCVWNHPLILGLLLDFLPPPPDLQPEEFYGNLADHAAEIDVATWDGGAGFAAALLERVIEPGMHAEELLATWPYLTRMYTTISPAEMMEDPIFHINADLGDIPQVNTLQQYVLCNGGSVGTLPDGREVYIPGLTWPDIPGEMWWAEEVQTIALKGAPMTLVNNTAAIDAVLTQWNLDHGWPREPGYSSGDTPTEGWTGGSSETSGGQGEGGGCGCRGDVDASAGLLGLGLLGLGRRRRR